jgi:hypothetical protein
MWEPDDLYEGGRDWPLTILEITLMCVMGLSAVYIVGSIQGQSNRESENYMRELNPESLTARDREQIYISRLSSAMNPFGAAPVCFVISLGFLAVLRAL